MNIYHNGLNYSLQQTARESLYVVTTPAEKYKARAFTNMFVQRLAKGLSIFLVMGLQLLSLDIRYLSVITILVAATMILCSVFAGRVFRHETERMEEAMKV
jgi:AAA family ATP:ADP antiporter